MKIFRVFLLLSYLSFSSCITVETSTTAKDYRLKISSKNRVKYIIEIHKGAGSYKEVSYSVSSIYSLQIPTMQGGYSSFLFIRYNVHNPRNYKVIRIREKERTVIELSMAEIEKLPSDSSGVYILNLD